MFILTILHELEHAKQIKTLETTNGNTFEKSLIQNSLDIISINPDFYRKEHDLFPTERMAIINSTSKLIEILKIDGAFSLFINEVFVKEYNWFITNYYIHKNIPLLEYINISGIHLYYEDILINKENTKSYRKDILSCQKDGMSFCHQNHTLIFYIIFNIFLIIFINYF